MRLLCAVAAAALAASSIGCQAIQSSKLGSGLEQQPPSQIIQASHVSPSARSAAGIGRLVLRKGAQQASCGCGSADCCGASCGSGCESCGPCGGCGGNGCGACGGSGMCCDGNNCINNIVGGILDCNGGCLNGGCLNSGDGVYNFQPGPPVGQTAYPYYTVRGPRDFLARNPRSIGPTGAYGCR